MMRKKTIIAIFMAGVITLTASAQQKVKNVIFMIGDGMGVSQVYAAYSQKGEDMNILKMPYTGLVRTCSASNYITDSAAAGTALSSGVKTNNGMIGLLPDSITQTVSIMEIAKRNGLNTGIGVTCSITHATPAAYYAHQISRKMDEAIALDILTSDIDVCIGGGRKFLENRQDGKNISKDLREKEYDVVYTLDDVKQSNKSKIIGLLADDPMPMMSEGREDMLPKTTEFIIEHLNKNNPNGFFVMIEGSQIDWGGHANDQQYVINETIDFDEAVRRAIEFAKADKNTLVIVTADHETGGMTLIDGDLSTKSVDCVFSTTNHTATPVPVYAFGPGAEVFTGYFDNTQFKTKIANLLGLKF